MFEESMFEQGMFEHRAIQRASRRDFCGVAKKNGVEAGKLSIRPREMWAAAIALMVGLGVWVILSLTGRTPAARPSSSAMAPSAQSESQASPPSLLDQSPSGQTGKDDSSRDGAASGVPATDEQLERQFAVILEFQRQLDQIEESRHGRCRVKERNIF